MRMSEPGLQGYLVLYSKKSSRPSPEKAIRSTSAVAHSTNCSPHGHGEPSATFTTPCSIQFLSFLASHTRFEREECFEYLLALKPFPMKGLLSSKLLERITSSDDLLRDILSEILVTVPLIRLLNRVLITLMEEPHCSRCWHGVFPLL